MSIITEAKPTETVALYNGEVISGFMARMHEAVRDIDTLRNNPPKSIHVRMKMYDRVASAFLDHLDFTIEMKRELTKELKQERGARPDRNGKRWLDDEDILLIERVAAGDSIQKIANTFGRTPLAVSGRVSHLVGIKRITEEIAGRIEGYLNGAEVEGVFVGKIRK